MTTKKKLATYTNGKMHEETKKNSYFAEKGFTKSGTIGMKQGKARGCGFVKINNVDKAKQTCTIIAYTGVYGRGNDVDAIWTYSSLAYSSIEINNTEYYTLTRMSKKGSSSSSDLVYWGDGEFQPFTKGIKIKNFKLGKEPKTVTVTFRQSVGLPENPDSKQNIYNWNGTTKATITIPSGYIAPSNLILKATEITSNSITVKATWTVGSGTTKEYTKIKINGSNTKEINKNGGSVTFNNLTGNKNYNISGILYDNGKKKDDSKITETTHLQTPYIDILFQFPGNLTLKAKSNNYSANNLKYQFRYKSSDSNNSYSTWITANSMNIVYISSLISNTKYSIQVKATRNINPKESNVHTEQIWTRPLPGLALELINGSEHNSIKATAFSKGGNDYAKYIFRLDSQEFNTSDYNKTITNPKIYTGLLGNSTHTIGVKMKNTQSGLESDEVTATIPTWHNPISNLTLMLENNWYWYLSLKTGFMYEGDKSKIKYEFSIDENNMKRYENTGNINKYSKGTTDPNKKDLEGLKYNTYYNCSVRLTDEYGRIYNISDVFKTLDERSFYLNNSSNEFNLMEVKLLNRKENNVDSLTHITPNLVNILNKLNNTESIVNLNKVINNDDRSEFK